MRRRNRILDMSLRQKILLLFSLTWAVLVVVLASVAIYTQMQSNRNAEVQKSVSQMALTNQETVDIIESIDLIGIRLSTAEELQSLACSEYTALPQEEQNSIIMQGRNCLYEVKHTLKPGSPEQMILVTSDKRVYSNLSGTLRQETEPVLLEAMESLQETAGSCGSYSISVDILPESITDRDTLVYRRTFYADTSAKETGELILLISRGSILRLYDEDSLPAGQWAICTVQGKILISNFSLQDGNTVQDLFGVNSLDFSQNSGIASDNSSKQILSYHYNPDKNLYCINILQEKPFTPAMRSIVVSVILAAVIGLAILIGLSVYLSKRLTEPLQKLGKKMLQAEHGDMEARFHPHFNDEIGVIGRQFDNMIAQLNRSMNDLQRAEQEKRSAELQVLELQINPHFLYNTLSTIIWMSNKGKNEEVIDITELLSNFFRLSLAKGREFIPVHDEVEHVQIYMSIQNYRYANEVNVVFDVPAGVQHYLTPKLILQPLVENALYHGVKTRDNGGIIRVCIRVDETTLTYEVWDNGLEMTQEKCQELNQKLQSKQSLGIGTGTVNERVKLHFGQSYGVQFSRHGQWTRVTVSIPLLEEKELL